MPIKPVPPRKGKSPNYTIRGTYLGVSVDRTAGTPDLATARKVVAQIKREIERGSFADKRQMTFAEGALSYIRAGGEATYLGPLNDRFGDDPLAGIEQADIDAAAVELYPDATPATRNRQVYTPISAVRQHNGIDKRLRRPKGAEGIVRIDWLWPEQAATMLDSAATLDLEFYAFLVVLLYCGPRLSEGLGVDCGEVRLSEAFAFIGHTKNGEPRPVHLPPVVVAALANHPRGLDRPGETVFRFRKNGHLYSLMKKVREMAGLPDWVTFHTLRHTWATWMRRYGKVDTKGLVATGAWADAKSAARYEHVVINEEAKKANLLPVPKKRRGRKP